jgi:hypothetical protein
MKMCAVRKQISRIVTVVFHGGQAEIRRALSLRKARKSHFWVTLLPRCLTAREWRISVAIRDAGLTLYVHGPANELF